MWVWIMPPDEPPRLTKVIVESEKNLKQKMKEEVLWHQDKL